MSGRQRLLVVALLRGREADEINALRRVLGSTELDRIAPHITLIAPMNVPDSSVTQFGSAVEQTATSTAPMSLVLKQIATFPPGHHVLYLGVFGEIDGLGAFRERLDSRVPEHDDGRPFVPHVTLKSHSSPEVVDHAMALMSGYTLSLTLDRVTLLRLDESSPRRVWEPCDEFVLGTMVTIGRGGREIVLASATMLNSQDREFLLTHDAANHDKSSGGGVSTGGDDGRETIVVRARIGGTLTGLVAGELHGEFFVLKEIVVDIQRRREGIGRQLMSYLERSAQELRIREILVECESVSVEFFAALGFFVVATGERDSAIARMSRRVGQ
jgi:2'-5' RNA ligase/GNAT superfamily N-acetyltransferase